MKRWPFLIGMVLGYALPWTPGLEARVLRVEAGTDAIGQAVLSAVSGDTLMLTGRSYHETRDVKLPAFPLTIVADPALSAPPIWTSDKDHLLKVSHDLAVKGIRFDGRDRTRDAIRNYAPGPNKIVVTDCEIASFTQDGVTENGFPVDTCIVRNTVFHDIVKDAIAFRSPPDMCRNLVVENCTFYRVGDRAVYVTQKDVPVRVRITNITAHDCFGGVRLDGAIDAVVSNSILTGCRGYAVRSAPPLTLNGICTFQNTKDYELSPGGAGCFNADPRHWDAAAGDFSLLPDSPCLKASASGGPVGDLRWTGAATIRAGRLRAVWTWGRGAGIFLITAGVACGAFLYLRRRVRRQEAQKAQAAFQELLKEALRESQEQYQNLFENAPIGIYRTALDGRVLLANPTLVHMLGYASLVDLASRDLEQEGFDSGHSRRQLREVLAREGRVKGLESAWIKRDGSLIFVRENARAVRGENGNLLYYEGTVEDITEYKKAEKTLRDSEEQYRMLFENNPHPMFVYDLETLFFLAVNDASVDHYGYSRDEFLKMTIKDIRPLEDVPALMGNLSKPAPTLERAGVWRHRKKDGTVIDVEITSHQIFFGGRDARLVLANDVTERTRAEKSLRESREHSRQIIETANEAFIEIDSVGLVTNWNRMAEVIFGWTREEAVGRPMSEMIIPPQYREAHRKGLEHFLATGEGPVLNRRIEITALYRGEHEFPVEITIWPIQRGDSYRFNAFIQDITERKRAEEALRESNRRLEEAMAELRQAQQQVIQQERLRALGQMASGIAHDFNNALSPILGFSELLLTVPENLDDREKATRYLRTIHTAAQDAANVVSRLREFYRHREKGEFFQPVHLNRLVEQTISLTQPRWKDQAQAEGRTVDIRTDLKPVPFVAGNEAELREVLTNLIFNAVDAMPEGGTITIRTRVTGPPRQRFTGSFHHPGSQVKDQSRVQGPGSRVEDSGLRTLDSGLATGGDGSWVEVAVSDTGTGMTEEVRQRCLEPFFSTKGERGTGLGLAMVFGTVQRHEGEIDIETEPGRGTTFILRFPVMRERGGGVEGRRQEEGLSRPLRVLVVDDNPTVRELVIAYLAIDGHTVDSATSGREGLEKFRAGHYDLVLTDRAMPEMGGDQMAAAVKRLAPRKPVIMLTGFGDMMQAADENPAGVDVVLSKPVTRSKLREALAKVQ